MISKERIKQLREEQKRSDKLQCLYEVVITYLESHKIEMKEFLKHIKDEGKK